MSRDRARGRRTGLHAFRPTLDGRLESRCLLASGYHGIHMHARVGVQTQLGGRDVLITLPDHQQFRVSVNDDGFTSSTPTVYAKLRRDGSVDITAFGTTVNSILQIDPVPHPELFAATYKGRNHGLTFPGATVNQQGVLNVHSITIKTGAISQILAYRTANLTGPLVIPSTAEISRLAFLNILPGGSIITGGDVDTLDVFNDAVLTGGNSLVIGRDLNWFNVGGSIVVNGGSVFSVNRYIGLRPQAAKGTDPGGQGGVVLGSIDLRGGGSFQVGHFEINPATGQPFYTGGFAHQIAVYGLILADGQPPIVGPTAFPL